MIIPILVTDQADTYENCSHHEWRLDTINKIWYCLNCSTEYAMDSPYELI